MKSKKVFYIFLLLVFAVYSTTGIFTKLASGYSFLSPRFCMFFACALGVIGIYAVLWQMVLKHVRLSVAYMMKSVTVVYGMLVASLIFGEHITVNNIIGCLLIIVGILLLPVQKEQES